MFNIIQTSVPSIIDEQVFCIVSLYFIRLCVLFMSADILEQVYGFVLFSLSPFIKNAGERHPATQTAFYFCSIPRYMPTKEQQPVLDRCPFTLQHIVTLKLMIYLRFHNKVESAFICLMISFCSSTGVPKGISSECFLFNRSFSTTYFSER